MAVGRGHMKPTPLTEPASQTTSEQKKYTDRRMSKVVCITVKNTLRLIWRPRIYSRLLHQNFSSRILWQGSVGSVLVTTLMDPPPPPQKCAKLVSHKIRVGGAPPPPQKCAKLVLHTFGGGGHPPLKSVQNSQQGKVKLLKLCRTTRSCRHKAKATAAL